MKKKINGWICVDSKDNLRFIKCNEPPVCEEDIPEEYRKMFKKEDGNTIILDRSMYPGLKYEDNPIKVELVINEIPVDWGKGLEFR